MQLKNILVLFALTLIVVNGNACSGKNVTCSIESANGFLKDATNLLWAQSAISCKAKGLDIVSTMGKQCGGSWWFVNLSSDYYNLFNHDLQPGTTSAYCTCGFDGVFLLHSGGTTLNSQCTGVWNNCAL